MDKHNHINCLHDIRFCSHCDVVYCVLCSKEWGQSKIHYGPGWRPNLWDTGGPIEITSGGIYDYVSPSTTILSIHENHVP